MTELICWPLDNKQYTSVALGAAYAARSRGVLNADSFAAKTNGNNTVTVGKGVGCIHVSDQWAAFPFSQGDVTLTFEDADYKGGTNFAGKSDWSSLIDSPQYGGSMLYHAAVRLHEGRGALRFPGAELPGECQGTVCRRGRGRQGEVRVL